MIGTTEVSQFLN